MNVASSAKSARQSNMELLRIISMVLVLLLHLNGLTISTQWFDPSSALGMSILGVQSLTMVAVNCFILLSGYFTIRPTVVGFAKLYLWWLAYSIISMIVGIATEQYNFSWSLINDLLNPFTSRQWFVKTYMLLYLLSPIFNSAVEMLNRRGLSISLSVILIADCCLGWIDNGALGFGQYGLLHMITIYLLGAYIRRYGLPIHRLTLNRRRTVDIALYLSCSLILTIIAINQGWKSAFVYNSLWVIIASVAMFDLFDSIHFHSDRVNRIATSAFSVYLLHHGNALWYLLVTESFLHLSSAKSYFGYITLWVPIMAVAIYSVAIVIDRLRLRLTAPLIDKISHSKLLI